MKVEREDLLKALTTAAVGLTPKEILEQSNAFVFTKDSLVTYNGEILTRIDTPLRGIEGAVPAEDLLKLLSKFPDDEIEIFTKGEELRIKGNKRAAGMARVVDVALPFEDVPAPTKWKDLPGALMGTLYQASHVCGRDETQEMTTVVHLTSGRVEACDNTRMFRSLLDVDIEKELLIPALSLDSVSSIVMDQFAVRGGWLHFKTKNDHVISIRCAEGNYPELEGLLEIENPQKVVLPGNLVDILARAEVMHETSYDAMVSVTIAEGELTLKSRKDTGWYRETRRCKYSGRPLSFEVHPKFLGEIVSKTRRVLVGGNRMKIESGDAIFVVSLEISNDDEE